MKLHAIACNVLSRALYQWAAVSEHVVDITLLGSENHDHPEKIHALLQQAVDAAEASADRYDFLLLGYGLCGKVLEGLQSRGTPLVVPRVHDCIRLFLGPATGEDNRTGPGKGTMYYIEAWLERNGVMRERKDLDSIGLGGSFAEYAARYGEENAAYLIEIAGEWMNRYHRALYVGDPLTPLDFSAEIRRIAEQRGWQYHSVSGDSTFIRRMVCGEWAEEDFHIVPPWCVIQQSYDDRVVGSVAAERRLDENGEAD